MIVVFFFFLSWLGLDAEAEIGSQPEVPFQPDKKLEEEEEEREPYPVSSHKPEMAVTSDAEKGKAGNTGLVFNFKSRLLSMKVPAGPRVNELLLYSQEAFTPGNKLFQAKFSFLFIRLCRKITFFPNSSGNFVDKCFVKWQFSTKENIMQLGLAVFDSSTSNGTKSTVQKIDTGKVPVIYL